jgi:uncharacterized protein (TIGR01777 family)
MDSDKRIIITGGSGFLGSVIAARLKARGALPIILDINPPRDSSLEFIKTNLSEGIPDDERLKNPHAVINLAGAPIFGRWNSEKKKQIYNSRIIGTKKLVESFEVLRNQPKIFVSASAVGFYGECGEKEIDIQTKNGEGFLAHVANDWEKEARVAESFKIKTIIIRNGLILGKAGLIGFLKPFYKWGIGGPIGNGKQWMPWIHVDDCAEIYVKASLGEIDSKIINAVAPEQIQNKSFSKTFSQVLRRPNFLFIPKFALKILYGGFANEITISQKIKSDIQNFDFKFEKIYDALNSVLS